jgi:hypothetical protein
MMSGFVGDGRMEKRTRLHFETGHQFYALCMMRNGSRGYGREWRRRYCVEHRWSRASCLRSILPELPNRRTCTGDKSEVL